MSGSLPCTPTVTGVGAGVGTGVGVGVGVSMGVAVGVGRGLGRGSRGWSGLGLLVFAIFATEGQSGN